MMCVEAEKVPRVDESNLFIDRIVNVPSLGPPDGIGPDIPGIGGGGIWRRLLLPPPPLAAGPLAAGPLAPPPLAPPPPAPPAPPDPI